MPSQVMNGVSVRLSQALAALPGTSRGVAEFLLAGGYVGERNSLKGCPVALYLGGELGGEVCVAMDGAWIYGLGPYTALPSGVRDFVDDFDKGKYPSLVRIGGAAG